MFCHHGIRDFLCVAGPKVLAGGLQFALTLALLRRFDPVTFGVLSVCLSGVLLVDSVVGGATDSGVLRLAPSVRKQDPLRSLQFQQAGLTLKCLLVLAVVLPASPFAGKISSLLFQTAGGMADIGISLGALAGMLALRSVQMHYQVEGRFVPYGAADLASSALKFGSIGLLLYFAKPSAVTILTLFAAAPILVTAIVLVSGGKRLLRVPFSGSALAELFRHVKWFVAVSATGTLMSRLDVFMVSSVGGVGNAGIYSAAQTFSLVPQLIGSYIAVVFSPRIMPMLEAGTLRKLYQQVQSVLLAFAVLGFSVAVLLVPKISGVVFPASFLRAGPAIVVLLPAGLCALINFPLTILLLLFTRPRFLIALDCILLPVVFVAYRLVIPTYGVLGAAIVTTTATLLKTAVMQVSAWRMLRPHPNMAHSSMARYLTR
jgi:O-antigen/teichoic acid export membrane protein